MSQMTLHQKSHSKSHPWIKCVFKSFPELCGWAHGTLPFVALFIFPPPLHLCDLGQEEHDLSHQYPLQYHPDCFDFFIDISPPCIFHARTGMVRIHPEMLVSRKNTTKIKNDTLSVAARPELHGQKLCFLCIFCGFRYWSALPSFSSKRWRNLAASSGVRGTESVCCCVKRFIRRMKGRKKSSWNFWSETPSSFLPHPRVHI